jgi:hypothetical protein
MRGPLRTSGTARGPPSRGGRMCKVFVEPDLGRCLLLMPLPFKANMYVHRLDILIDQQCWIPDIRTYRLDRQYGHFDRKKFSLRVVSSVLLNELHINIWYHTAKKWGRATAGARGGGGVAGKRRPALDFLGKYVLCCWSARDGRFDGDCSLGGGG